jgi:hypothetical protein
MPLGEAPPTDDAMLTAEHLKRAGAQTPHCRNGGASRPIKLSDIKEKAHDCRGHIIKKVFIKTSDYAIYKAGDVTVAFADDPDKEAKQRRSICPLGPARAELEHLLRGLNCRETGERLLANSLALALECDVDGAKKVLAEARDMVVAKRCARGRFQYLKWSYGMVAIVLLSLTLAHEYFSFPEAHSNLWLAAGAGLLGAVLSIAQGIKGRTVALDSEPLANITDGILRLLIGMVCAGILFIFLQSGLLPHLAVGDIDISAGKVTAQAAIVIGFVAGFLERLVPDLLEKKVGPEAKSDRSAAAADANRVPATAMR